MPVTAETISLGLPVAIDRIDRELKKLWSEGEGAMTRASLMNLAVYSEEPDSLNRNTLLLAQSPRTTLVGQLSSALTRRPKTIEWKRGLARIVTLVAPGPSEFAPNKFHFCSKARRSNSSQALSFPNSIPISRFIFGGNRNLPSRWTRSCGRGSID